MVDLSPVDRRCIRLASSGLKGIGSQTAVFLNPWLCWQEAQTGLTGCSDRSTPLFFLIFSTWLVDSETNTERKKKHVVNTTVKTNTIKIQIWPKSFRIQPSPRMISHKSNSFKTQEHQQSVNNQFKKNKIKQNQFTMSYIYVTNWDAWVSFTRYNTYWSDRSENPESARV